MENDNKQAITNCSTNSHHTGADTAQLVSQDENQKDSNNSVLKESKSFESEDNTLIGLSSKPSTTPSSSSSSAHEKIKVANDELHSNFDADDDGEDVVTLDQLLAKDEEEEGLIEAANAVLGAADDEKCSYSQGYMARQPLYSCLTCARETTKRRRISSSASQPQTGDLDAEWLAGVCLACSIKCHDGHELVELYTKRNFRCDCGNFKFTEPCPLEPGKDSENERNVYNHNFEGLYCVCRRPYPDPNESSDDMNEANEANESIAMTMVQCIFCEDWFHWHHLWPRSCTSEAPLVPPLTEELELAEMVCARCVSEHPLVALYRRELGIRIGDLLEGHRAASSPSPNQSDPDSCSEPAAKSRKLELSTLSSESASQTQPQAQAQECYSFAKEREHKSAHNAPLLEPLKLSAEVCKLDSLGALPEIWPEDSPAFFHDSWREQLCRCRRCLDLYSNERVSFLLIKEDTIASHEEKGRAAAEQRSRDSVDPSGSATDGEQSSGVGFSGALLGMLQESVVNSGRFPRGTQLTALPHIMQVEMARGLRDLKEELVGFFQSRQNPLIRATDVEHLAQRLRAKTEERRREMSRLFGFRPDHFDQPQ